MAEKSAKQMPVLRRAGKGLVLMLVAAVVTLAIPACSSNADKQVEAAFDAAIRSYGWEPANDTDAWGGSDPWGHVIFGDCKPLYVKAPRDNPSDITLTIPARYGYKNGVVNIERKLKDTPYEVLKANRFNYLLGTCFLEPKPQATS